jgi:hypothetical protein
MVAEPIDCGSYMYFDALTEDCEYLIIWNAQVSLQNI